MSPEATPAPAPSTSPAQWEAVAEPQPATLGPAEATAPPTDEWVLKTTIRRGIPGLMILGWTIALMGLALVAYAYQKSISFDSVMRLGGVRADYLGVVVLLLGLVAAAVFHFVPMRRPVGLLPTAPRDEIEEQVRWTNGQVLISQVVVGVGLGLAVLGLLWMVVWLYRGYQQGQVLESTVSRFAFETHYVGGLLVVLGLLVCFLYLGRVGMARAARNLAVVAHHRHGDAVAAPMALPGGVSEAEVRNLVKRLDGLMARLPDDAVTEFSRTAEADTYLKLLGS